MWITQVGVGGGFVGIPRVTLSRKISKVSGDILGVAGPSLT